MIQTTAIHSHLECMLVGPYFSLVLHVSRTSGRIARLQDHFLSESKCVCDPPTPANLSQSWRNISHPFSSPTIHCHGNSINTNWHGRFCHEGAMWVVFSSQCCWQLLICVYCVLIGSGCRRFMTLRRRLTCCSVLVWCSPCCPTITCSLPRPVTSCPILITP